MNLIWIAVLCAVCVVVAVMALAMIGLYSHVSAALSRIEAVFGQISLEDAFRGLVAGSIAPPLRRSIDDLLLTSAFHGSGPAVVVAA